MWIVFQFLFIYVHNLNKVKHRIQRIYTNQTNQKQQNSETEKDMF